MIGVALSLLAALLLGVPSLYGIFIIYRELEIRRVAANVRKIRAETLRENALAVQLRFREQAANVRARLEAQAANEMARLEAQAANEMARLEQERRFDERLAEARIRQRLSQRHAEPDFVDLLRSGARNTPAAQALLDQEAREGRPPGA